MSSRLSLECDAADGSSGGDATPFHTIALRCQSGSQKLRRVACELKIKNARLSISRAEKKSAANPVGIS